MTKGTMNVERLLYTVEEAASALGIGRTRVFYLIQRGEIESVLVGSKSRRIPHDALCTYVQRLRSEQSGAA